MVMELLKEIPLAPFKKGGNYSPPFFKGGQITRPPFEKGRQNPLFLFRQRRIFDRGRISPPKADNGGSDNALIICIKQVLNVPLP